MLRKGKQHDICIYINIDVVIIKDQTDRNLSTKKEVLCLHAQFFHLDGGHL